MKRINFVMRTGRHRGLAYSLDWEIEGTRFKSCLEGEGFFPTVLRPTVNWELVAWHEGNMDAANGIFGLWPLGGGYDLLTSHRFRSCIWRLDLGVVASPWKRNASLPNWLIRETGTLWNCRLPSKTATRNLSEFKTELHKKYMARFQFHCKGIH